MSGPHVLIVEDNLALADNMAELLEELGVVSHFATSAAEARRQLQDVQPALSIVDVTLPDGNGVSLVPELQSALGDSEVILVTGHGTLSSAIEAIRLGAFGYLLKPLEPEGFVKLASRALSGVSLRIERRRLARRLSASETLHRTLVDAVDAAILGLDVDGGIVFANSTSRGTFGEAVEVGHLFIDLFEDEARVRARQAIQRRGEGAEPWAATWKSRSLRWTVTEVGHDATPAMVVVGVDMTERDALRRRAAEKEALAAIGVLTAGLAHEIRNPLNAAQLQLQLLSRRAEKGAEPEALTERAGIVQTELHRLSTLLDEFLGLARPSPQRRSVFDLGEAARAVVRLQAPLCAEHGVELNVQASDEYRAFGNEDELKQVMVNLIANAREAMATAECSGTIDVVLGRVTDWIEVSVLDDGPGPVEGDLFEPFRTTKPAGTGLGLSIVRSIVQRHGGDITLAPRPTGGAIARVRVPVSDASDR